MITRNPEETPPKVMPFLDLLRFFAALLVMLNHLRVEQFAPYGEVEAGSEVLKTLFFCLTRVGLESVLLFFVLSGFLVGGMSVERALRREFTPEKYFIDRFTRIYTPLAPALAFDLGVCLSFGIAFSWREAGLNLLSLQGVLCQPFSGNSALWSLSYEVWFYILAGAVLALIGRHMKSARIVLLFLMFIAFLVFLKLDVAYLFAWMTGLAAFFIGRAIRTRLFWFWAVALTLGGLVLMQITSKSAQVDLKGFSYVDRSFAVVFFSLGLGLLVSACAYLEASSPFWERVAELGTYASRFSYSLYLFHIPLIILMLKTGWLHRHTVLGLGTLAVYLGNAVLLLMGSYLFYLCFEKHTPDVRDYLYRKLLPASSAQKVVQQ